LSKSPISRDDRDRIHFAREILLQRLADPPSLVELARLVGLNDYKLKAGFRQVFGTTVFGYLRQERLEKARQLLQAQDISVTAAAAAVGYSSQGHFAAAFRKQFGINPKDLRAGRQI
jgi:AraC-like DNA-binding protein